MINLSGLIRQLIFVAGISSGPGYGQTNVSQINVSADNLKQHVFALASDQFQGRKTGTAGQLLAAIYCTQVFRQSHLLAPFRLDSVAGSFRQSFAFTTTEVAPFGGGVHTAPECLPTNVMNWCPCRRRPMIVVEPCLVRTLAV